jgi:phosphoglycerate dehydrogenase-like enzyme
MASSRDRPLILLAEPLSESAIARLQAAGRVLGPFVENPAAWKAHLPEADALLVRTYTRVTAADLDQARNLRVIGRAGVGLDNIDVESARRRGIAVVFTPAASTQAVAELAVGLIVSLQRRLVTGDAAVRSGAFGDARRRLPPPCEMAGQIIGIVGMGRIGRALGRICALGLGMKVLFNDLVPISGLGFPAAERSKSRLFAESDIISLHVPLTDRTRGLINATALAKFKPGAWLINTARGAVVDSAAVAAALHSGRLAGAAFDVLDPEPPPADHPLLRAPNCLLSPHIGSRTEGSLAAMNDVVDDVLAVLAGKKPAYPAP